MNNWEMTVQQLKEALQSKDKPTLLDVREPHEVAICSIEGAMQIPMREIPTRINELPDPDQPLVVFCHLGMRSMSVVNWLRESGWSKAVSLRGGIDQWAEVVDPKMQRY